MNSRLAAFLGALDATPLRNWREPVEAQLRRNFHPSRHGDLPGWLDAVIALPCPAPLRIDFNAPAVTVESAADELAQRRIRTQLERLKPWRKGPFDLHGIYIDAEWRSNLKWERIADRVDLRGANVLDVGSGNGYYGWRMLGAGARTVVGIDPTLRYVAQFLAVRKLLGEPYPHWVLPLGVEDLPAGSAGFDAVFSMGVLYHRRSPIRHLEKLRKLVRTGGRLILETLVVEGDDATVVCPEDRYAMMRNVWFIPSVALLERWLRRTRFKSIELLDVSPTTADEQRVTEWSTSRSLSDFLDPADRMRTVEGYPAPVRAVIAARA